MNCLLNIRNLYTESMKTYTKRILSVYRFLRGEPFYIGKKPTNSQNKYLDLQFDLH